VAFFQALPLLGSRLAILLLQCFTTVFAIAIEWVWLGTRLTTAELACGAMILAGVAIALRPSERLHFQGRLAPGLALATLAALGNALGMVLSRKAYAVAGAAGQSIDGGTAAYQRVIGGLLLSGIFLLVAKHRAVVNHVLEPNFSTQPAKEKWRKAWLWVLANGALGMALGVSCLQWALKTTPTGIVQSVLSMTPLAVIPLARVAEGERPSRGALLGGVIAVAGTITLTWVHLGR
jgi:drug/metabolite transporter (DMT)-like permease